MKRSLELLWANLDEIPKEAGLDNWWKKNTRETFRNKAKELLERTDFSEEEIVLMLGSLYWAVSDEFGD